MPLPISKEELPDKVQRFGAPDAPTAAKRMAARGLVPVKGDDLVTLLVQLGSDTDAEVAEAASNTLQGMPEGVVLAACGASLHHAILEGLAHHVKDRPALLSELAANRDLPDEALVRVARFCDERTAERIALDQQRVLAFPEIIEALYKNRNTRMSTADRLVELAARNGVELSGVATFAAHVEAIQGQLIPDEPLDEPLPSDTIFNETLEVDSEEVAVDVDKVDGSEEVREKARPLATRIADMSTSEKIRLTLVGNAAARSLLVRDPQKLVYMAAIKSPSMTDAEAARIAASKQISEDVLRQIGQRRDWLGNYEVKRNLVINPKTPVGISMKFLSHLRANDLRSVARSKNIPTALRTAAKQRVEKKSRR
ncbi:MAG: hypothetical protein AB8I08_37610 [Sandaracinaceae bacterium]